jgi:hypothetical protein
MSTATASSDLSEAAAEVWSIADGLSREVIEQRARQAFGWANECRERYQSILDASKRGIALRKAFAWAEILKWMDSTGDPVFSAEEFGERPGPSLAASAAGWLQFFWPPAWARACGIIFGSDPIVFYEWAEGE